MLMFTKKKLIFIAILFFAWLMLPSQSSALEVQPAIREVTLTPGQATSVMIELNNDEADDLTVTAQVVNFTAVDNSGNPIYLEDAAPTGAATWANINNEAVLLKSGELVEYAVNFNPPATAQTGGHYVGALFSFSQADTANGDTQLMLESKVGVPILITVDGDYTESGKITTFATVDGATSYTAGPIEFMVSFKNTGEVHLKPIGNIVIKNMFGSDVATLAVNESAVAVLPDNTRALTTLGWEEVGSAFGKYTAEVTLSDGAVSSTATVDFWVLSTMGIVIAVVVVIVIIILLIVIIKAASKKKPAVTEGQ